MRRIMIRRLITILLAFIFANSPALQGQASRSPQPTGKLKITIFDTADRIVPNVQVSIQGNGTRQAFMSGDQASHEFDLPSGIYTITTEMSNGYNYPFRRSDFFVEAGATILINVLPPMRITSVGTGVGTGSFVDVAPRPKYQEFKVPGSSKPEMNLVVQYDQKSERGGVIEYKDGARPFSGVVVTYNVMTIVADVVRLDKETLRIEARGNVIVEDGKKRERVEQKEILPHNLDAQSHTLSSKAKDDGLRLPSFSIFGLEPSKDSKNMERPFDPNELENFLAEIGKEEVRKERRKENEYYWIIPMVFYRIRNLFSKESWTAEEIIQGQQASQFFARLVKNPDLRIEKSDQDSFKNGLLVLRNWFAALCQDNKTLAAMIFTMNDGPYFGGVIDINDSLKMKLVESTPISGKQASFVLMTDDSQPQPMIIGVLNEDKSIRWLKRFTNPPNKITRAELQEPALYKVEGYGYAVALMTEGTSGRERSHVYLDDSLNLRFYYVSW